MCHCVDTVPRLTLDWKTPLLITQIALAPVTVFSQTRSDWPLPKSPTPAICQLGSTVPKPMVLPVKAPLFISQIARTPVAVFSQTMSAFPSPLKSPAPTICHSGPWGPCIPKAAIELDVPTNTFPLQTVGTANVTATPIVTLLLW